jgi:hypothetical protein
MIRNARDLHSISTVAGCGETRLSFATPPFFLKSSPPNGKFTPDAIGDPIFLPGQLG